MRKHHVLSALIGALLLLPLGAEELLTAETYASYYGEAFNGRPTSSGEIFDMNAYTAAHKTLPFGTFLEVTNLENGKKVVVRVNDRGPFVPNREIDLSKAAATSLGMISRGITRVSIKKVDSLDHAALVATNDVYSESPEKAVQKGSTVSTNNLKQCLFRKMKLLKLRLKLMVRLRSLRLHSLKKHKPKRCSSLIHRKRK